MSPCIQFCSNPSVAVISISSLDIDKFVSLLAYLIDVLKLPIFLYKRTSKDIARFIIF